MTPILWLHAFPLSAQMFEAQHAIAGVRHVAPDLPGFGAAPPLAGEPTIDAYARFVIDHLDSLGIQRAVFAGVSMGGYIALSAIRDFRDRVAGLILIDTRETADTADARKGRFEMIAKIESEGVTPLVDSMFPKMLTPAAPEALKEHVRAMMMATSPRAATDALKALASRPDSTPLLPGIDVPALVVVGEGDTITPPSDAMRMAKAIPGAKLVTLAGAAHLPNVEQPDAFNRAVSDFLSR
jgi:3-oxoadipate enol-lactonase